MANPIDAAYFVRCAADARQSSLEASNPAVRGIYRELVQRFEHLSFMSNAIPPGAGKLTDNPCDSEEVPARESSDHIRRVDDPASDASADADCAWENEGGALHSTPPATS